MAHISSLAPLQYALLNGQAAADPCIAAYLATGDRLGGGTVPEFGLRDAGLRAAHGRLTWDPEHARNGSDSPFFSVAPVRLDMKATGECLLSVGTADYVSLRTPPFQWIEKVQVAAAAGTAAPGRSIRWDLLEILFCYADGRTENCRSMCLPAVATGLRQRRPAQAVECPSDLLPPRQYTEIATGSREIVALKLRGQVTLRANEIPSAAFPLCPEDLQGQIAVFTDASRGRE
jgi:hypothetical protein